jgi:hypothetical protein
LAIRGTRLISCADSSGGGIDTSAIDVRRDAVDGYALAEARVMDKMLDVSSVVGTSLESTDWNKSGYLESRSVVRLIFGV